LVGVLVGVSVGVFVGVFVAVSVGVGVFVGVSVGVGVGVWVGVSVGVGVAVSVGVSVGVGVGVLVGVSVGVGVSVAVGVFVGVFVGVLVAVGVAVGKATVTEPLVVVAGMVRPAVVLSTTPVRSMGLVPLVIVPNVRTASRPSPLGPGCAPVATHAKSIWVAVITVCWQEMPLPVLPRNPPSLTFCRVTKVAFQETMNSY
jgi:hypothetical protein